ncbi:unnamed protein product [Didymodactylos carnosus]|uniref:Knottins-like domain-containing protein n=1 Tax=Didymodactylos carnosus TaxID=1234261 RepID=A0A815F261_9BILA|nr:unnamed protein product [Didymodactylos carnosus]CAF1317644.1 unnamed protein product [Didymodactylos carnosus]CAF4112446.1 unnamed protein product [Didymodactylos carnosus]CAF4160989.1 unnamed protein product [Didymodactylos carnosus]
MDNSDEFEELEKRSDPRCGITSLVYTSCSQFCKKNGYNDGDCRGLIRACWCIKQTDVSCLVSLGCIPTCKGLGPTFSESECEGGILTTRRCQCAAKMP